MSVAIVKRSGMLRSNVGNPQMILWRCDGYHSVCQRFAPRIATMESNVIERVRFAALTKEIDAIHFADRLFWSRKVAHTRAAIAEYQSRQERLVHIRGELARLGAGNMVMVATDGD
jgi:hypothetical protein